MPAGMNDFEREAPTDKGRKKRQRARIIALPALVTVGNYYAKILGVSKLLFKPLPEELADPIRTKLDERAEVRRALLKRRRAEKAAEAIAKGGL
ncbi:hypothetical protein M433DRAFT_8571 [Acidomyces richmondensis BFW]|nr:MAG: hypothetical protein FE78DRAFT_31089 [Acidomyces sp. 'richmondensis']KYG40685.1 hypothetical protein M433DRAFT_8571 [Acidomyces richmondensis BFW]